MADTRLSYWEKTGVLGDCDVMIIGAGIVGLTAARYLALHKPHWTIKVIESQVIGAAASSRNAGFACYGSVSEVVADIERYGADDVKKLVDLRRAGLKKLLEHFGKDRLDYQLVGGYEVFRDQESFDKYESQVEDINTLFGEELFQVISTSEGLNFYNRCLYNAGEGHLNTGLLYRELRREVIQAGIDIITGVRVERIKALGHYHEVTLEDLGHVMKSSQIVVTTNALTKDLIPGISVQPCRNQVIVTQPLSDHGLRGTFHLDEGYIYFRDIGDRILIGGGRHRFDTEETGVMGNNQDNISYLMDLLTHYIVPHSIIPQVAHAWSGILTGGDDRRPIVKRTDDNVVVAVRLGGMGVAIGSLIGEQAATLVME